MATSKYFLSPAKKELLTHGYIRKHCANSNSLSTAPIEIIELCDQYLIFGLIEKINEIVRQLKYIMHETEIKEEKESIVVLKQQPSLLQNGTLRDYQLEGLKWLIQRQNMRLNCILADEMGLGKTIQCISLFAYNLQSKNINNKNKPYLLIVPLSTIIHWRNEINVWCPKLNIFSLYGQKNQRKSLINKYLLSVDTYSFNICITTYEICRIESKYLNKINWFYIITDEGHMLKTHGISKIFNSYKSLHRLAITGTPIYILNDVFQIFAFLNFLFPNLFQSQESFDELFKLKQESQESIDDQLQFEIYNIIKPIILRRLKKDIILSNIKKIKKPNNRLYAF